MSLSIATLSRLTFLQPTTLLLQVEIVGLHEVAEPKNLISTSEHALRKINREPLVLFVPQVIVLDRFSSVLSVREQEAGLPGKVA